MKNSRAERPRLLILDGDHKNTLAIVRHLGKKNECELDVTFSTKSSICYFSKYTSRKLFVNNPKLKPEAFIEDLIKIVKQEKYLAIIPVSYISYQLCASNKDAISSYTHLTIASPENILLASNKIKTYNLAEKLGIPYPKIYELKEVGEIDNISTTYPCVIKSPIELGKNVVDYAHSKAELVSKYKAMCSGYNFGNDLPIIQKFIVGEGAGFFAYYKNGQCLNYFMHKRIREYPVSGGSSVVAEAFYNEQILNDGIKILDELRWEGVVMVEFKKDNQTGHYNLMEINAKFWGSLDLALVCGADFPQMLINDAKSEKIQKWNYQQKKFQWILNGDLFYLFERPLNLFKFITDLVSSKNDFWLSDIGPNLFQFANIPVHYYKKWFK